MQDNLAIEHLGLMILHAGVLEIRDVPRIKEIGEIEKLPPRKRPFLYTTGNRGPGYVHIKELVAHGPIIKLACSRLAYRIFDKVPEINFVVGTAAGGIVPGWLISEQLETILGRPVPFVYFRVTVENGQKKKTVVGLDRNPEIPRESQGVVVDELINFAETVCDAAEAVREKGYRVSFAATILSYKNPEAEVALRMHHIESIHQLTLSDLLDFAEKNELFDPKLIRSYRAFQDDPIAWQKGKGLLPAQ